MMAGEQAKVEKYEELILALQKFNADILQSAENMSKQGRLCLDAMGSDQLSTNCVAKLEIAVKQYRNVTLKSTELQKKLVREKENLQRLINMSRMEG